MQVAKFGKGNEYYRMRVAELEKSEVIVNKIMGIIDNTKQCYSNTVEKSHDDKARAVALDKWKALDDIQKEIEWLQR